MRFDQAALLRFHIAPRNGGEIDIKPACQLALGRQAIRSAESAAANVLRDGVGNGEVTRLIACSQIRHPVGHSSWRSVLVSLLVVRGICGVSSSPIAQYGDAITAAQSLSKQIDCIL